MQKQQSIAMYYICYSVAQSKIKVLHSVHFTSQVQLYGNFNVNDNAQKHSGNKEFILVAF